ncbi:MULTISPECIES: hypothetical protein [Streptomyces]|uniref:hypothetical protein n=1 Tax=Streptomyces TaxID=1883 RepID=UPI003325C8DF
MATNDPARDAAEHLHHELARLQSRLDTQNPHRVHVMISLPDGTLIGALNLPASTVAELGDTAQLTADYADPNLNDLTDEVEDALAPVLASSADNLHPDALTDIETFFDRLDRHDLLDVAMAADDQDSALRAFDCLVADEIDEDGAF